MTKFRSLAFVFALMAAPSQAQTITGPATALDGKTLDMTGTVIVLAHVDAPDIKQTCARNGQQWPCGTEATENLTAIIGREPVECTIIGVDPGGNTLATCETETFDVGREMARRGMALVLDGAPEEYGAATGIAQQLKFGLWGGEFQSPAEWRAANPKAVTRIARVGGEVSETRATPARRSLSQRYTNGLGCAIKGNRSIRGEWIYHLPGQAYYDATRPEDMFCTEREAQAAGYRRSKE